MNISLKFIVVGKIKEEFYRNKIIELQGQLAKKCKVQLMELPDESIPQNPNQSIIEKIKEKEGDKILEQICGNEYVIPLCIEGKSTDLNSLKRQLQQAINNQCSSVVFIIGGSLGLHKNVTDRANYKMSFSNMTFPHQLMRVMLMEQVLKAVD